MKPLSETDTHGERILSIFQINKDSGFSDDYKSVNLALLYSYFSESNPIYAKMCLGRGSLDDLIWKLNTSYEQHIRSMCNNYVNRDTVAINPENEEAIVNVLLEEVSDRIEDFHWRLKEIKEDATAFSQWEDINKDDIFMKIQDFFDEYYPKSTTLSYKDATLDRVHAVLCS